MTRALVAVGFAGAFYLGYVKGFWKGASDTFYTPWTSPWWEKQA